MRQGMSGLPIYHEPLNGNYSSCIMQRSNQSLPFCTVKEMTWSVLQGPILSIYLALTLHEAAWKAVISSLFSCRSACLGSFLRSAERAAMCFGIISVVNFCRHTDEFYIMSRSHLASNNMCRVPFSFTHYRQHCWPCASGSCTTADVLALQA